MKKYYNRLMATLLATLFASTVFAGDAEQAVSRYLYNAERGAWPVSTTPEEKATPRYIETPPALTDLKTLQEMSDAITNTETPTKYMAVLFTGWDWCEAGSRLLLEWRKGLGDTFVTTVYDWPETDYVITEEGENQGVNVSARSREVAYAGTLNPISDGSSRAHVWPALALYDGEGKLFAFERGIDYMDNTALKALVANRVANYEAYLTQKNEISSVTTDTLATAAAKGEMGLRVVNGVIKDAGGRTITLDIYKAALLANALIALEPNVYSLPFLNTASIRINWTTYPMGRQADVTQIQAWDPQDVSGAMRRIQQHDLYYTAEKFRVPMSDERKTALAELVDDTRLVKYSNNEYQQALLCGYNLYMKANDKETAQVYARRAIATHPSSFWGEGARGRLLLDEVGPVTLGHGWKSHNITMPTEKVAADGTGSFTAEEILAQDGLTITQNGNSTNFTWTMRYGNDLYLLHQGWYNFVMRANSGAELTVNAIEIYMDTAEKEDPTKGTKIFDGTKAVADANAPQNGDNMAAFTPVTFGRRILGDTVLSFNFYMPRDAKKVFPYHERNWSGKPLYNDVAIVIKGSITGKESAGSFAVNPIQTATAQTAPNATQITIDGETMSLSSVLDAQRAILDEKTPTQTLDGDAVADAVLALLTGEEPDADYIKALTRGALFYEYESEKGHAGKISEVAKQDYEGIELLTALLKDTDWVTDLLASGPGLTDTGGNLLYSAGLNGNKRGAPEDLLHRLALLWRVDKIYTATKGTTRRGSIAANAGDAGYDPLIRRMATVGALNAAPSENGMLGQTHWIYRDHLEKGVMHADFLTQSAAQMRHALNPLSCHPLELSHAVKTGSTRINYIDGTAWQTSYLGTNFFGTSINNGGVYFGPWNRTVLPEIALGREIGAVCGGISKYGVLAANATGRRSVTGGQPGHCAAAHRSFDGTIWDIDSNVSPPTGNHFPYWGDHSYYSLEFYDDMWDDPRTLVGYQLMWSARLRALSYGEADPGVEALYHRAVTYAPLCYQAILAYRDYLKDNFPYDADRWLVWAEAVTYGLWRYPSIGWNLLNANLPEPLKAQYGEIGALAAFKQLHVRMHDSNRKTRESYNYEQYVLTPQTKLFNETNMIALAATALDARYGTPRFNNLINWGNSYYIAGTHAYTTYQTMLQSVYEANGNPLGVKATCLEALRAASKDGNLVSFNEMSTLYVNLFQNASYPTLSTEPLPYDYPMVSADGAVTLSSYPDLNLTGTEEDLHESAQAFCHAKSVINNAAFGVYSVWTQPQTDDPWVMVQLPGDAEIFGVVVQNGEGALPLTIEISADAQTWTTLVAGRTVAEGEKINVPFNGSTISKYVRVRYSNLDGREVRLKLNKIQVFAKKRY